MLVNSISTEPKVRKFQKGTLLAAIAVSEFKNIEVIQQVLARLTLIQEIDTELLRRCPLKPPPYGLLHERIHELRVVWTHSVSKSERRKITEMAANFERAMSIEPAAEIVCSIPRQLLPSDEAMKREEEFANNVMDALL